MMQLRWEHAPYRRGADYIADVPDRGGRYRVKKRGKTFDVIYNGCLVATEPSLDDAKRRAEVGADLIVKKKASALLD